MKRLTLPILLLTAAHGQSSAPANVTFTLTQDLIKRSTDSSGATTETVIESPKTVLPGDLLREQVTLRNVSGRRLGALNVNLPVPRGTEFSVLTTPAGDRWTVSYSIDGGKTFSAQPRRRVTTTEGGQSVTRDVPAPTSSYTNVRWTVSSMQVNETLKFSIRVKVK
ncbi:hypothetical protein [Deinococcus radiotolerans]|uniref:DUF11 domain-containing protein n=1 Tax=Deinococcus radiotolerans TaxID=1309407 RepID=A0ABQ2FQI6_9DEIO|nr:hypothetical protein [Deinococcus radiotolerans]GGL17072.1 hypothetical protein GCM10010844_39930 [Deinococcus radiotolerans]